MHVINQTYATIKKRIDDVIYIYRIVNTKRDFSKLF